MHWSTKILICEILENSSMEKVTTRCLHFITSLVLYKQKLSMSILSFLLYFSSNCVKSILHKFAHGLNITPNGKMLNENQTDFSRKWGGNDLYLGCHFTLKPKPVCCTLKYWAHCSPEDKGQISKLSSTCFCIFNPCELLL